MMCLVISVVWFVNRVRLPLSDVLLVFPPVFSRQAGHVWRQNRGEVRDEGIHAHQVQRVSFPLRASLAAIAQLRQIMI